ncbi:MAG: dihydropteroate synthase, partial [Myxococcota bacterium]|nr:dihydropteroate synthase [Myxococcota bacterium]
TEIRSHLSERLQACVAAGVAKAQVLIDPGIGFGKTLAHNLALLRGLPALASLGSPLLVGTSRKRFLGELTGSPVEDRDPVSATAAALSVAFGAHVVRVHDVAAAVDSVRVADAIAKAPYPRLR